MTAHVDSVQRVLKVLQDVFGSKFAAYYDGDPEAIPTFNLPALIVTQTGTSIDADAFAEDKVIDQLTVKIVYNKRDDFTANKVDTLNMTERKIREIVGLRDAETGNYDVNTVQHAVRNLALEGVTAIGQEISVEYGINPRPTGEGFADLTAEGHVSFGIEYIVLTH